MNQPENTNNTIPTENEGYKTFEVTFTTNKKYNPITRTVKVHAMNDYHATMMVHKEFGSFHKTMPLTPSNKIKIDSVIEVKEETSEEIAI